MSLPKLVFPGGALVGDDAGFLNASRIKGSHAAIKTGMLAAEAAFDAVQAGRQADELTAYPQCLRYARGCKTELYRARNFKQWMSKGLYLGTLMVGLEQKVMGGNVPWTLHHQHADQRDAEARVAMQADRLSEAGWQADVRPACRRCSSRTRITRRTSRRI